VRRWLNSLLSILLKRGSLENDLERELQSHLELEFEDQQDRGVPPEEARYAARRAFGNAALIAEDVRAPKISSRRAIRRKIVT
jgi:hypothetical protein